MKAIKRCKIPGGVLWATFALLSCCSGDETAKAPGAGAETAPASVRSDRHRALTLLSAPSRNANQDDEGGDDEGGDDEGGTDKPAAGRTPAAGDYRRGQGDDDPQYPDEDGDGPTRGNPPTEDGDDDDKDDGDGPTRGNPPTEDGDDDDMEDGDGPTRGNPPTKDGDDDDMDDSDGPTRGNPPTEGDDDYPADPPTEDGDDDDMDDGDSPRRGNPPTKDGDDDYPVDPPTEDGDDDDMDDGDGPTRGNPSTEDGDETPGAGRTSNPGYPRVDYEEDYVHDDEYVMDYQDEDGGEESDPNDLDPDDQPEGWKAIPIDELPSYMGAKVPQEMVRPTQEYLLANTTTVRNMTGQKLVVFMQGSGDQVDVLGTLDLKSEFSMVGLVGKKLAFATLAGETVGNSASVVLTSGIMQLTAEGAAKLNSPSRQLTKAEKKEIKAAKIALKFTSNPALRAILKAKIAILKAKAQLRQLIKNVLFVLGFVPGGSLPFPGIIPAPIPPSFFSPVQNLLAQLLGVPPVGGNFPIGGGNFAGGGGKFPGGGGNFPGGGKVVGGGNVVINGPFGGKVVIGGNKVPGGGKIPVGGNFPGGGSFAGGGNAPGAGGLAGGGLAGAAGNPGFKLKPLRTQWSGGNALTSRMSKSVIHTPAEWKAAWKDAHPRKSSTSKVPNVPVVDFKKHMVVAVFMGDGWKGHPVSITSVKRSGSSLRATVRETVPPAGVTVSKLKSPYCFQQVTASKLPVTFVIKK